MIDLARFWSKIDKRGTDECWPWLAGATGTGYGALYVNGRTINTHRIMYELAIGPIPNSLWVLHHCDNPLCVNPAHLWLGTHADNMKDREAKGRANHCKGEHHGRAKLTKNQVLAIREDSRPQHVVAIKYGVRQGHISRIKNRTRWSHI